MLAQVTRADFNWNEILYNLWHMLLAYALAFPLGWDREKMVKSAGLRTFPLVAMGACSYMLIGISVFQEGDPQSRVIYGLITGIGFIGGGAILKERGSVTGTATAASLWNTAAIGIAVAWDHFEIAILLSIVNFVTLRVVRRLKERLDHERSDASDD